MGIIEFIGCIAVLFGLVFCPRITLVIVLLVVAAKFVFGFVLTCAVLILLLMLIGVIFSKK
jgi:hypothetical protein